MEGLVKDPEKASIPFNEKILDNLLYFSKINVKLREGFLIENCGHFFHPKCYLMMKNTCFKCEKEIKRIKIIYY